MTGEARAGAYLTKKLRALDAALGEALAQTGDDAIHDMRVAIRRLRTALKASRRIFGRRHADAVRRAFTEVMRATSELRDEEVLRETLDGLVDDPAFAAWLAARRPREQKLRRAVARRLERGDLERARLLLKAMLVFPVDPDRDMELGRFARRVTLRARRAVDEQRDASPAPDDARALHDLRIAYKELRYSIELFSEVLPLDLRAMLEPAATLQKRLGELHDVDVALEVVAAARDLPPETREAALAALGAMRERRLAKYLPPRA